MNKILYAINLKAAEDKITDAIKDSYIPVGVATYKEAVIEKLVATGADTLLLRETLPGSMETENLIRQIRLSLPEVRIIIICVERTKQDPFLKMLANLAIYDIINDDKPTIATICSFILTPRTYRDVARYGVGVAETATLLPGENEQKKPEKKSIFGNLFSGSQKKKEKEHFGAIDDGLSPNIDIDILRQSIRESEQRKALAELDEKIEAAVQEKTTELQQENEKLQAQLEEERNKTSASETHFVQTVGDLNALKEERDALQIKVSELQKQMKDSYRVYESQISDLKTTGNTPDWYTNRLEEWVKEKEALEKQVAEQEKRIAEMESVPAIEPVEANAMAVRMSEMENELEDAHKLIQRLRDQIDNKGSDDVEDLSIETEAPREIAENKDRTKIAGMVIVTGTRHGVGSTTVALNLATSYAMKGTKTLLVEIDPLSPMLNSYFEFTQITAGIEEALEAFNGEKYSDLRTSLIVPKKLVPKNHELKKAYKKLPADLHFMLYSNKSLIDRRDHNLTGLPKMLEYLRYEYGYKNVVLNVSCDNIPLVVDFIENSQAGCKLYTVLTQDTVAIASASKLIQNLGKSGNSVNLSDAAFVVTRYNEKVPVTKQKIARYLNQSASKFFTLSEDTEGYFDAVSSAQPYVLIGKKRAEYKSLNQAG